MVIIIIVLNSGGGGDHSVATHDSSSDVSAHKEAVEPEVKPSEFEALNKALEQIALKESGEAEAVEGEKKSVNPLADKIAPDAALLKLKEGNIRFAKGESTHPNLDPERRLLAATENQNAHAFATVLSCSDSRVPVEAIFDAGVMDIFTIRVAGNVCDTDEIGSIEYGAAHVLTPVVVVLGHTQCGAVTAVTHSLQGHGGHELEENIPPLIDNVEPAVKKAIEFHPEIQGDDIIPIAIEQNVWTAIEDLLTKSPAVREYVINGYIKLVGAIYDIGTGNIDWLSEQKVLEILSNIQASPNSDAPAVKAEESDGSKDAEATEEAAAKEEAAAPPAEEQSDEPAVEEAQEQDSQEDKAEEESAPQEEPAEEEPAVDKA
ncbi:MAG: carbonic anhydrase [Desulfamplus sp.]|nr:carbonic anhydrase [Desulfamplus sp.]MBF0389452.1 carbonic anhydrase [Desulfamplus sp.]